MSSVILIGSRNDVTFNHVVARSKEEEVTSNTIWLENYLAKGSCELDFSSGNVRIYAGKTPKYEITSKSSVYCRLYDYRLYTAATNQRRLRNERMYQLQRALQCSPANVIPRPFNDGLNTSKPRQTLALSRAGFRVPRSLATTSPKLAKQFIESCRGQVIYKSTSSERSIVSKISDSKLATLHQIRHCPVFFQEYVEGFDVRLHLLGSAWYAEHIEAPGIDYRYAAPGSRKFFKHHAPSDIVEKAVKFMREHKLTFAGFDFKVCGKTGVYYCLEANPNPGFEGYDFRAGGMISKTLLEMLCSGVNQEYSRVRCQANCGKS